VSALYDVVTEKFGTLIVERDNIDEARHWAKEALGLGPRCVSRHVERRTACPACDSSPCCCGDNHIDRDACQYGYPTWRIS